MKKFLFFIFILFTIFAGFADDINQDKKKVGVFIYGPVQKVTKDLVDNAISGLVKETSDKYIITEHSGDFEEINDSKQYYQIDDPKDRELLEIAKYFGEDYVIAIMMVPDRYVEYYLGARMIDVKKGEAVKYWDTVIDSSLTSLRETSRQIGSKFLDLNNY